MSNAESEELMRWESALREPNPHISERPRPLIMKKQRAIMASGNIHQYGKPENSEANIFITS